MNSSLLLCFLSVLPIQLDVLHLALPLTSQSHITNYRNSNFSQSIHIENNKLICRIETRDYLPLTRHFRIVTDPDYLEILPPKTAQLASQLLTSSSNLSEYITSCSSYLEKSIHYDKKMNSDDPEQIIISGKANCIGYCSLFSHFLKAGGIESRVNRGFLLFTKKNGRVELIPHRWLEITLNKKEKIFFDPQYQSFSATYIRTDDHIEFTKIKEFDGLLIKRNQRLSNQEAP